MQHHQRPSTSIRRPTRLIKYTSLHPSRAKLDSEPKASLDRQLSNTSQLPGANRDAKPHAFNDVAGQPTRSIKHVRKLAHPVTPAYNFNSMHELSPAELEPDLYDISYQSTRLMELSGMMRAVRVQQPQPANQDHPAFANKAGAILVEEEYWPHGIQQTGALPIVNLYGSEPFGKTLPQIPVATPPEYAIKQPVWKAWLSTPAARIFIGLLVGIGLLYLVSKYVDFRATIHVLQLSLTTPRGITLALLSGIAFLTAFCIRGIRWKLFLNPVGQVSTLKAIQLFLVGIFLNFLLPIRGGEVAKSLMLKRISNIPVSQSLPTVAMDKALDLMPALLIMAIVPFLGVTMDIKLWVILATVGGLLMGLVFFIALAAWKRTAAIGLLEKITGLLPGTLGKKIAGFATGFVDSLLLGASQPKIFIPAILLTCVAVIFDGLFAMLAFWTIGYPIPFGTAIFGYTVYNMFYILPTPPGQVGSNEVAGLLVFHGLLGIPADKVTAMFVFSHPWAALLMTITGMACLSALGLTISSAMKVQSEGEKAEITQKMMGMPQKQVAQYRP
ncbi:MAG TPA: lysylphosphatidylglycerol synthase transmembrane domain-containing protein [Ktedonobacteraceae bacterium]|nr:lysylphosphatidylglycerol synthase transmembrane domain-containing protein [Ktedonobacteraceae bacterium]